MVSNVFGVGTVDEMFSMKNTDLTNDGKCSQCGACCSAYLPLSDREVRKIRAYIKKHHIEPVHHVDDPWTLDGVCPFCDTGKPKEKCRIYDARPNICRRFICSDTRGHRFGCAKRMIVDMWDEFYTRASLNL